MEKFKYIILGGGTTAGYAAKEFAGQGIGKGELCILSAESILPMDRPPLSKGYLKGEDKQEDLLINDKDFYKKHGIEVMLNSTVKQVDLGQRSLFLNDNKEISFGSLLIATGSKLRKLKVPGRNLGNVFYLRKKEHSDAIREAAKKARKAVVVGGQYIGSEVTAALTDLGVKVTMVFPEDRLLDKFSTPHIARFFEEYYADRGVTLFKNDEVTGLHGEKNVSGVELRSGEMLEADMVVAGIGVKPDTDLFLSTPLHYNNGIVVNEYGETNVDDVYAAGDVCVFPDPYFDKDRHVEHWENAYEMGPHVARSMMGKKEPYKFLPYFFSDVFDLSYEYFGDQEKADQYENRGEVNDGDFSTWWLRGNVPVAAFIMSSRPDVEREKAREWITGKVPLKSGVITDENIDFKDI